MKAGSWLLGINITALLIATALYFFIFCMGDGPDPIDTESILTVMFGIAGILSSVLLIWYKTSMHRWLFWLAVIVSILIFTIPAVITSIFLIMFS